MADQQVMQQFQEIENKFNQVLCSNNADEVGKYFSEDWFLLEPGYGVVTRDQFLNSIKNGNLVHKEMKREVLNVKLHDGVAIVTVQGLNKGVLEGQPFDVEIWATNVYRQKNDNWVFVHTHESPKSC